MTREEMETRRLAGAGMLQDGVSQAEVARRCDVSRTSTMRWAKALKNRRGLKRRLATGRPSKMTPEDLRSLLVLWETRSRWTGVAFAEAIARCIGVTYDPDHVLRLMVRLGLRAKRERRGVGQLELEAV